MSYIINNFFIMLWIVLLATFSLSFGQLPRECTLAKEVFDYECCPNTTLGICGGADRGSCENITSLIIDRCQNVSDDTKELKYCKIQEFLQSRPGTGRTDFRYRWPTQIFQRICVCKGNYDDYNCMRCKRGFTGDDCSQPSAPVIRRNILSLNDSEQDRLLNITQMIKSVTASGYTVPIREPVTSVSNESFAEISLFDVFATFHYNTIRDEEINQCSNNSLIYSFCNKTNNCSIPNFAHEGPAFLTWHRGYLLYVETEIQKNEQVIVASQFSNPPNRNTDEAPVDGPFSSWDTICTNYEDIICNASNQVCNPNENLGRIQRCIGGTQGVQCRVESTLPSMREVNEALKETVYDTLPYNKSDEVRGFRNSLEGFRRLVDRNMSVCPNFSDGFRTTELHNRVHIYTGGTMLNVPTSSNDPVFFLHHCNVDRLYEEWLDRYSDDNFPSYQPNEFYYDIAPGHNIDEFLVPMFPPITNRDMHKRATSLGYTYKPKPLEGGCMGRSYMSMSVMVATLGLPLMLMLQYI